MGKSVEPQEAKSAGVSPFIASQLFGSNGFGGHVTASSAYVLWEKSNTLGNAVDLISWPFSQMSPALKDKKTGEYLTRDDEHPALALLANPRRGQSAQQFLYQMMTSFCIAGASYPVLTGNVRFDPAGMYHVGGNHANLMEGSDGWLGAINYSANYDQNRYYRQELPNRPWVYQTDTRLAETIQIMAHERRWGIYPQSPVDRIVYQVLSKYWGLVHNSSMLQKGTRPGGLWSPGDGPLSQDQYEAFKNEVASFTGPGNSGKSVVAPRPVKFEDLSINTKDMDFLQLIESNSKEIYSMYQIPLPLVETKTMTLNNYQNATTALYTGSVLPRSKFILKEFGQFLLSRYKDGDRFELCINEKEIPALKDALIDRQKKMKEAGSYSINEIRAEAGYESAGKEADTIYQPATMVPIADDDYTEDNPKKPEGDDED